MSTWYDIEDPDDIDLTDDGKFIHLLFDSDEDGNKYVSVSVELIKDILADER